MEVCQIISYFSIRNTDCTGRKSHFTKEGVNLAVLCITHINLGSRLNGPSVVPEEEM